MRARRYTNKIDFKESVAVADGFGGFTNEETFLFTKWCAKETQGAGFKFQQYGLNDFKNPAIFRIRKGDNVINEKMFIIFNGNKFIIKGIENVNLEDREINIYCDQL